MPRIVDRIVRPQPREPVRARAPQRPVLRHIRHHDLLVLLLLGVRGVERAVGHGRPRHPAPARAVHDARVDLAKGLVDVVVEAGADADACGPGLYVADLLVRIVGIPDVEADKVVKFKILENGQE